MRATCRRNRAPGGREPSVCAAPRAKLIDSAVSCQSGCTALQTEEGRSDSRRKARPPTSAHRVVRLRWVVEYAPGTEWRVRVQARHFGALGHGAPSWWGKRDRKARCHWRTVASSRLARSVTAAAAPDRHLRSDGNLPVCSAGAGHEAHVRAPVLSGADEKGVAGTRSRVAWGATMAPQFSRPMAFGCSGRSARR